jgi:hypothetical protein
MTTASSANKPALRGVRSIMAPSRRDTSEKSYDSKGNARQDHLAAGKTRSVDTSGAAARKPPQEGSKTTVPPPPPRRGK